MKNFINKLDLADIGRALYPTTGKCILFLNACGIFTKIVSIQL